MNSIFHGKRYTNTFNVEHDRCGEQSEEKFEEKRHRHKGKKMGTDFIENMSNNAGIVLMPLLLLMMMILLSSIVSIDATTEHNLIECDAHRTGFHAMDFKLIRFIILPLWPLHNDIYNLPFNEQTMTKKGTRTWVSIPNLTICHSILKMRCFEMTENRAPGGSYPPRNGDISWKAILAQKIVYWIFVMLLNEFWTRK